MQQTAQEQDKTLDRTIGEYIDKIKSDPAYKKELRSKNESYEALYSQGYHFYEKGHYDSALTSFHKLIVAHPFEAKYWFGLAATLQEQKKYEQSLHPWSIAAIIDYNNPLPHFHAAECLFSLGEIQEGFLALKEAKKRTTCKDLISKMEALEISWKTLG